MEDKTLQEDTSIYFNHILNKDYKPLRVNELPEAVVEDFNKKIYLAFTNEGEITCKRIHYLIPYILQSIDWEAYGIPLEAWQIQYYYHRDRFLEKTRLSYDKFMSHIPLQKAIEDLRLEAEPTFEFILFLKYYFGMRSELRYSALELFDNAVNAIENLHDTESISMDLNVGGKHYKFSNSEFVKQIMLGIDKSRLKGSDFINDFNQGSARDKIRAIDYYILKTLLDYLPVSNVNQKTGAYSQQERNFGLSVLSFLGRLPDNDRDGVCSKENNATFDKLMRDFRNTPIPFAMELFL